MIHGDGPLAEAIRAHAGDTAWCWIAYDEYDHDQIAATIRAENPKLVILSTPVPVGTCRRLEGEFYQPDFAVVPENIRTATATHDWTHQPFCVLGARRPQPYLRSYLGRITSTVIEMEPESAEMAKLALNGWLATQIEYANEIGRVCEQVGANPFVVMGAVANEPRKYLKPGGPPGAHLMRDVRRLRELGFGLTL